MVGVRSLASVPCPDASGASHATSAPEIQAATAGISTRNHRFRCPPANSNIGVLARGTRRAPARERFREEVERSHSTASRKPSAPMRRLCRRSRNRRASVPRARPGAAQAATAPRRDWLSSASVHFFLETLASWSRASRASTRCSSRGWGSSKPVVPRADPGGGPRLISGRSSRASAPEASGHGTDAAIDPTIGTAASSARVYRS